MEDVSSGATSANSEQLRNYQQNGDVIVSGYKNQTPKCGDEIGGIPFFVSKCSSNNLEQLWGEAEFVQPPPKDSTKPQGDTKITTIVQNTALGPRQFDLDASSQHGEEEDEEDRIFDLNKEEMGESLKSSFKNEEIENVDTVKNLTSDAVPTETKIQVSLHNGSSLQFNLTSPGDIDELLELAKMALEKRGGKDHKESKTKAGGGVVEEVINLPKVANEKESEAKAGGGVVEEVINLPKVANEKESKTKAGGGVVEVINSPKVAKKESKTKAGGGFVEEVINSPKVASEKESKTKAGGGVVEEAINLPKVANETVKPSSTKVANGPVNPSSPVKKGSGQAKTEVKPIPAPVGVALVEESPKKQKTKTEDKKPVTGSKEPVKPSPTASRRYQPKRANVRKQGLKLSELLKSEVGIDGFTDFCNHEHNDENIRFFLECIEYSSLHHEDDRKEKAEIMVQDFIVNTADYQVNLDHGTYVRIMEKHKRGEAGPALFKEAQHSVFKLMRTDSFSRFKKTSQYVELCLAIMDPTGELGVIVTSASAGQSNVSDYHSSSMVSDAESSGAILIDRGNVPMNNSGGSVSPTTTQPRRFSDTFHTTRTSVVSPLRRIVRGLRRLLRLPEMRRLSSHGVVYPIAEMDMETDS